MGIGIGDLDLKFRLGIGDRDWGLVLGIRIGNCELRLGIGIGYRDGGLVVTFCSDFWF